MTRNIDVSVKAWVVIAIVMMSAFIYAPVTYLFGQSSKEDFSKHVEDVKKIASTYSRSMLGFAIASGNQDIIRSTIKALAQYRFIYKITVLDEEGNPIAYASNPAFEGVDVNVSSSKKIQIFASSAITQSAIDLALLDEPEPQPTDILVGYLVIDSTTYLTDKSDSKRLINALTFSLVLSIITLSLLYMVLRSTNKHVSNVVKSARSLAAKEKGIRISADSNIKELNDLSRSFNVLAEEVEMAWKQNDEAELVYEAKNNILQIAAHELRTPIASLKTYSDITINQLVSKRSEDALVTLKKSFSDLEVLDRQVNSILALSALEHGQLSRNDEWVNPEELLESIDQQFKVKCQSKPNISFTSFCTVGVDSILLDKQLASIVIANAVDNAIKYTNMGFVKVQFRLDDHNFKVIVHDSGIGLTDDEKDILLSAPRQLENNIKRQRDGWGIGMATMQKFTEYLDGYLDIESRKDFGTKVTISFPVGLKEGELPVKAVEPVEEITEQFIDRSTSTSSTYISNFVSNGLNVLVIDNDFEHLQLMEQLFSPEILRRDDVQVTLCSQPVDAINEVEEKAFDLILIDYHMPKMDGLQLLKFLDMEGHKCNSSLRFILTADTSIPKEVKAEMEKLSNGVISKGLTSEDVRCLVRRLTLKAVN